MQIEVGPGQSDQRPPNRNRIRVINNSGQQGEYQILPNGMLIECPPGYDETLDLAPNATEFWNKGNVTLDIEWL
jgi:hypothetical protein